jgi:hypothetical protein
VTQAEKPVTSSRTPDAPHSDFVADAERSRRRGDAHAALDIAEAGLATSPADERGRIALALALIDLGDLPRAREELARALEGAAPAAAAGFAGDLAEDELDTAFAAAETNPDEMMDANRVVERTLEQHADLDGAEGDFDLAGHPTYATETMASLLAGQGREAEADALRASLARSVAPSEGAARSDESGVGPDHAEQLRIVTTLEGWLHNLRRNAERDSRVRRIDSAAGRAR